MTSFKKLIFFIFVSVILSVSSVFSQDYKNTFIFAEKVHFGRVINNYVYMDSFPRRKMLELNELYFGVLTRGQKAWQERYGYPEVGFSVMTGNLGSERQLGNTYGIIPTLTFNLHETKSVTMRLRVGMGLTYFDNPFDSIKNPYNILVGSHITNLSMASLIYQSRITDNLFFTITGSTIHASNGHYQIPNVGLNIGSLDFGFKYYFSKDTAKFYHNLELPEKAKKVKVNFSFGIGQHEFAGSVHPVGTQKWTIYRASLFLSKRISPVSNITFGIIGRYYPDYYHEITGKQIFVDDQKLKSNIFSIYLGHEFIAGHMALFTNVGYNFYAPFRRYNIETFDKKTFSNKMLIIISTDIGLKYYVLNPDRDARFNMFFTVAVRAHYGTADFPELGMGFTF